MTIGRRFDSGARAGARTEPTNSDGRRAEIGGGDIPGESLHSPFRCAQMGVRRVRIAVATYPMRKLATSIITHDREMTFADFVVISRLL